MKEQIIITKLRALKELVERRHDKMGKGQNLLWPEFEAFVVPLEKYRNELIELNSYLYGDFVHKPYLEAKSDDGLYVYGWGLAIISDNIQYLIDLSPDEDTIYPRDFKITTEGIFFAGQYFDAFIKVAELLKSAKSEIILIDGYINEPFLSIFTCVNDNVEIKILTKSNSNTPAVETGITKFNKQYASTTKVVMTLKVSEDFHDRFLIIDKKEYFHFGASLKDAGNKGFMFSKIEEPSIQKALLESFNLKW